MRYAVTVLTSLSLLLAGASAYAHDASPDVSDEALHISSARYIANEGVMAQSGHVKILFDPFQVTGFGTYQEPSAADLSALMAGQGEFEGVDAVFISHAHRDHFSAPQMIGYMQAQASVHLIAPQQALEMMQTDPSWDAALMARMSILDMDYGEAPQNIALSGIEATAVRIAHAGWPAQHRKVVQNMVYRITLGEGDEAVTLMHMGDADPQAVHYVPHIDHWDARDTDTAFPPYWFLTSAQGQAILRGIKVKRSIGVHVPINVPEDLAASHQDYFSKLGETRDLLKGPSHE